VVSEDGSIDLVPDLKPEISKRKLMEMIDQLRQLIQESKFDRKTFYKTLYWLSDHRFYLSSDMCTEINDLRRKGEIVRDQVDPRSLKIGYSDFVPHPDMNASYFLE
jgi:hypothetical protein